MFEEVISKNAKNALALLSESGFLERSHFFKEEIKKLDLTNL